MEFLLKLRVLYFHNKNVISLYQLVFFWGTFRDIVNVDSSHLPNNLYLTNNLRKKKQAKKVHLSFSSYLYYFVQILYCFFIIFFINIPIISEVFLINVIFLIKTAIKFNIKKKLTTDCSTLLIVDVVSLGCSASSKSLTA